MFSLEEQIRSRPILAYLLLCFGITWSVWFALPLVVGSQWALLKIYTALGFGPALAAIVIDRARGTAGKLGTPRWWFYFAVVFGIVATINVSILITGDALHTSDVSAATPVGLTPVGLIGSLAGAAMAGFILASLACSRSSTLNSILSWRASLRWWLAALLLPPVLFALGWGITQVTGGEIADTVGAGLPPVAWALFLLRSTLATLLIVAVGEEPGWRGLLLPELQKRFSPFSSSVFLGVVWGFWHLPLFVNGMYPDGPAMVVAKIIGCVMLSVLFTWFFNRSGGSLVPVIVLHTALNNTPRLLPGSVGMAMLLLLVAVGMIVSDRMWRRIPKRQHPDVGHPFGTPHAPESAAYPT